MTDEKLNSEMDVTQNEETLSVVDYHSYLDSVRVSGRDEEPEQINDSLSSAEPSAEDEVVAILLSAMMGSIVSEWTRINPSTDKGSMWPLGSRSDVGSQYFAHTQEIFGETQRTLSSGNTSKLSIDNAIFEGIGESSGEDSVENTESESLTQTDGTADVAKLNYLKEMFINNKVDLYGREFLNSDSEYAITFKQGNRYEGKLLNCRMHGKGKFLWADGSKYEGDFSFGKMTGQGKLSWPDKSWYEGEFSEGFRHGRGLYVSGRTFYAGYWRCGRRHGVGAMFYDHFDTSKHYYNGEWCAGKKHGTGLRSYPSGAMYSGEWRFGERHGLGTMVWPNGDVYSGYFRRGDMHGYGEYTWDAFVNNQLVVPEENCYCGGWVRNVRHGGGTLETSSGVVVKATWRNGKKHGPGEVVCSNGQSLYSDELFDEDNIKFPESSFDMDSLDGNATSMSIYSMPINAPSHEINVGYYVKRLIAYVQECDTLGKPFFGKAESLVETPSRRTFSFNRSFSREVSPIDFHEEENYVKNLILRYLTSLKDIYIKYAELCCDVKPSFPVVMMRLMWWQLLRDCGLHDKGLSLAHFDVCIANNRASLVQNVHYPFERISFWQFLHCLMEVSWELYTKKCKGSPSVRGVLASGLHMLIVTDLLPNAGEHRGTALFRCRDLLSLDSLYKYYHEQGEPIPARKLLKNIMAPEEKGAGEEVIPDYFEHQIRGKNTVRLGDKIKYLASEAPLLTDNKYQVDPSHPKNLSCLNSIGLPAVLACILQICPSISCEGLITNMDYGIVFLEFYEILILCTSKVAKENLSKRNANNAGKDQDEAKETDAPDAAPQRVVSKEVFSTVPTEPVTETDDVSRPSAEKDTRKKSSSAKRKPKKKK